VDNGFIRRELEQIEYEYAGGKMIHINKKGNKYDGDVKSPDFSDSFAISIYPWVERTWIKLLDFNEGEELELVGRESIDHFSH